MKVLMMTSPEPLSNKTGFSMIEKRFPLGMGYLLAVLKHAGHDVTFIDQYLKRDFSFNPNDYDFIGIYVNTPCYEGFIDLVGYIESYPVGDGVKIAIGGPHASVFPDRVPSRVNYIVQGEGEHIICDLVEGKVNERIIKTDRIKDIDTLPLPDYGSFVGQGYHVTVKWFPESPVFNMNTSRGCPFNCAFCSVKKIWGRKYTAMSAARVLSDIEYLVDTYDVKGIYFREDNFTLNNARVRDISIGMVQYGLKWACETRVDTLTEPLIKLMAKAGCKGFYIGYESGSQKMLDIYNKGTTVEQGLQVGAWARKYGIKIAASLITRHPQETDEDRRLTDEFIKEIKPATCWKNPYREDG